MMEQHEYIGEFRSDGALTIHGGTKGRFVVGEKVRVIVESIPRRDKKEIQRLDPATKRLLEAIDKAQDIGASDDPAELRHSVLFEERMKERFS